MKVPSRRSRRAGLAVLPVGALVACSSPVSTSPSTASAVTSDIARPVDVGDGRTLYLECHGSGTPTVVLVPGLGNAADVWQIVEARPPSVTDRVAGCTRVCSDDRLGSYVVTLLQNGIRVPATSPRPVPGGSGQRRRADRAR